MSDTEAIQDTIAKLMAKAKGTNNEHEAALFAAKAQELLSKHNLTEAQIRSREGTGEQPVVDKMYPRKSVAKWRQTIASGCAKLYFCKILLYGSQLEFVGKDHNVEVAMSMTDWLCSVVVRMAREYSSDRATIEDFKRGAATRLYGRLIELWRAQNPVVPTPEQTGTGLPALYASESKAVDDYVAEKYGELRSRKGKGLAMKGNGASAGYHKAGSINLNTQVAETRSSRMIGSR